VLGVTACRFGRVAGGDAGADVEDRTGSAPRVRTGRDGHLGGGRERLGAGPAAARAKDQRKRDRTTPGSGAQGHDNAEDAAENKAITDAMVRLLIGAPPHSDGKLTTVSPATKARLRRNAARARGTDRPVRMLRQFDEPSAVSRTPGSPPG
jgi:hypothetical protein